MCRPAEGAYALQLALGALRALLAGQVDGASARHVSCEAVMACVQQSKDRLVRGAALPLLELLAAAAPKPRLARMLEVRAYPTAPILRVMLCSATIMRL